MGPSVSAASLAHISRIFSALTETSTDNHVFIELNSDHFSLISDFSHDISLISQDFIRADFFALLAWLAHRNN